MLSIKNSLCSILMLATYAAAAKPGQSAINLKVEYCSEKNTGSSNDKGSNIYQTLGLCNDSCQGKFKYAVLQYQECWCSNEKPSETVDVEKCNQTCPGYPDQKCGNKGAGLYAYVPLDGAPFGDEPTSNGPSAGPASNSTMPAAAQGSSTGSNSTSTATDSTSTSSDSSSSTGKGDNSTSTSSSDAEEATYTGASNSLSAPIAMTAAFGLVMLGFAA